MKTKVLYLKAKINLDEMYICSTNRYLCSDQELDQFTNLCFLLWYRNLVKSFHSIIYFYISDTSVHYPNTTELLKQN